jgi:signal transduction histidine kinase
VKRLITSAIVGVAAVVLLALGIPLALVARASIRNAELLKLETTAARTLTEIAIPLNAAQLDRIAQEPDVPSLFAVYDPSGNRVRGSGPQLADGIVIEAANGVIRSSAGGRLVVATPIVKSSSEEVVGVLRVEESMSVVNERTREAWLILLGGGFASIVVAWLIAKRLSRSLTAPISTLANLAAAVGDGGVITAPRLFGIEEVDVLGTVLHDSSIRLNDSRQRERQFSADVSHQLRTPITGLRLKLERSIEVDPANQESRAMLVDLERLQQTLDHLLAYARDALPASSGCRLDLAANAALARWSTQAAGADRDLVLEAEPTSIVASASEASVSQILDVLIENALKHGVGQVRVLVRTLVGGAAVDVVDAGSLLATEVPIVDELFARGRGQSPGSGHGIGLSLGRSMAEAEGGRLMVTSRAPTTFSLILLSPDHE